MALKRVSAVQDDSGHWYVIPAEKAGEFFKDSESELLVEYGEFDNLWGKYRTGGDLNLTELWAEIE